ncbi:hypothetical protein LT493_34020 [Streptomyces tricolor]|nr:hypothetical protein [Streptomyces tricolor]
MLSALAVAHAHRVVHRYLSPDTVLVERNGTAMLTGFDYAHPGPPRPRELTRGMEAYTHQPPAYLAPGMPPAARYLRSRHRPVPRRPVCSSTSSYTGEVPSGGGGGTPLDSLDDTDRLDAELKAVIRELLSADPAGPSARARGDPPTEPGRRRPLPMPMGGGRCPRVRRPLRLEQPAQLCRSAGRLPPHREVPRARPARAGPVRGRLPGVQHPGRHRRGSEDHHQGPRVRGGATQG